MDGLTFSDEWAKPPIFLTEELPLALPEPPAAPVWFSTVVPQVVKK